MKKKIYASIVQIDLNKIKEKRFRSKVQFGIKVIWRDLDDARYRAGMLFAKKIELGKVGRGLVLFGEDIIRFEKRALARGKICPKQKA